VILSQVPGKYGSLTTSMRNGVLAQIPFQKLLGTCSVDIASFDPNLWQQGAGAVTAQEGKSLKEHAGLGLYDGGMPDDSSLYGGCPGEYTNNQDRHLTIFFRKDENNGSLRRYDKKYSRLC